jgi:hypothetical protein
MNTHELIFKSNEVANAIRNHIIHQMPAEFQDRVTVFGGAVRDGFLDKEINDYDLMVADLETEIGLMSFFGQSGVTESVTPRHGNYFIDGRKLQVLRGIYFPADAKIVANLFDFTICCCAVTKRSIEVHVDFFKDLAEKRLRLNRLSYPLATLERLQKFAARGFLGDQDMLFLLASEIQTVDLGNFDVVKIQLPQINQKIHNEMKKI